MLDSVMRFLIQAESNFNYPHIPFVSPRQLPLVPL
jgi:hypothetical protein